MGRIGYFRVTLGLYRKPLRRDGVVEDAEVERFGYAAIFGDHQRVCKSHPRRRRAVGLGRCPVRAQGSKVRFADHPEVGLVSFLISRTMFYVFTTVTARPR